MKRELNADLIAKSTNKSKTMWTIINKETGRERKSHSNIEIIEGEQVLKNPTEVANSFNSYFINSVQALVSTPDGSAEKNVNSTCSSIAFTPLTENEVHNIVRRMKNKTSTGVDGIPSTVVKQTAAQIIKPLTFILNASIEEGVFQQNLKIAKWDMLADEDAEWVAANAAAFFDNLSEEDVAAVEVAHQVLDLVEQGVPVHAADAPLDLSVAAPPAHEVPPPPLHWMAPVAPAPPGSDVPLPPLHWVRPPPPTDGAVAGPSRGSASAAKDDSAFREAARRSVARRNLLLSGGRKVKKVKPEQVAAALADPIMRPALRQVPEARPSSSKKSDSNKH
ncbi:hypothetical protein FOCC_FOCC013960 [Frankliniella occidentalis]|nr:hypothetical protein FOCC_FOCC013960 [Frankliniella occidentalis]